MKPYTHEQRQVVRRFVRQVIVGMMLAGAIATVSLPWNPAPANAGIFDFLFGGRDARGRASGRTQGGAVRSGRLVGGMDPTIPYILTPRNTYHLNSNFLIRWNPVPGAQTYTVRLWRWGDAYGRREAMLWETTTSHQAVIYDGTVPLNPARFYSVEVISDNNRSSDQDAGCATAGFSLLFPENLAALEADLATITISDRSPEDIALDLAAVYLRNSMLDYAIQALEPYTTSTSNASLELALAELYSYSGLNQLALNTYQRGLDLATASDDALNQAIALDGIGSVKATLIATKSITPTPTMATAIEPLTAAVTFYRLADQSLIADQLEQRINRLQQYNPASDATPIDTQVCQGK